MKLLGPLWGVIGVCAFIGGAVYRLSFHAIEALSMPLTTIQWLFVVGFALFMLVAEGYRGFQKKFSPRTAARVRYLRDNPKPLHVILAPIFCMGFIYANKKTRLTVIILTSTIICLVLLVRMADQPWRGLIDVGVVLGLGYGIISFLIFTIKALTQESFSHSPQVPKS